MNIKKEWLFKWIATAGILCLLGLILYPSQKPAFLVTDIDVSVTPTSYSGECPHVFRFTAAIKARGWGTVKYRWIRSDGTKEPAMKLVFRGSGQQLVHSKWRARTAMGPTTFWKAVEILSPRAFMSEKAYFTLRCSMPPARAVVNEIGGTISYEGGDVNLKGRRLKIILKKDGRRIFTQEKALDERGRCSFLFRHLLLGNYRIEVEKGRPDPENYSSDLNARFDGTTPPFRDVILTSGHRRALHEDFTYRYSIMWDSHEIHW
jgi:hypothetical protein